jgi:hypothetical protein
MKIRRLTSSTLLLDKFHYSSTLTGDLSTRDSILRPWLSCKYFAFPNTCYIASTSFSLTPFFWNWIMSVTQLNSSKSVHLIKLIWFLHISLSNSATWQNIFSYHTHTHISRFAQSTLASSWRALHFPAYCTCWAIHTAYTYLCHKLHYRTYIHATNSPYMTLNKYTNMHATNKSKYPAISTFRDFSKFGGSCPFWRGYSSPFILAPPANTYHVPIPPKYICFALLLHILLHRGHAIPSW